MSGFREELPQYKNINTYQDGVSSDINEKKLIYVSNKIAGGISGYIATMSTLRGRVTHTSVIQTIVVSWVYVAYSATSQYANQFWIIIGYIIGNKSFRCNLNKEYHCFIPMHGSKFENIACKITTGLFRLQCGNKCIDNAMNWWVVVITSIGYQMMAIFAPRLTISRRVLVMARMCSSSCWSQGRIVTLTISEDIRQIILIPTADFKWEHTTD